MQKYISGSLLLCVPFMLASCHVEKLPKRYKSSVTRSYPAVKDSMKYFVSVTGYVYDVATHEKIKTEAAKNIFSLSGEGQQQLIESIADNEKTSDELLSKLALDIIPASREVKLHDNTRFTKKVSFSIDNMHLNPADRILKVIISMTPATDADVSAVVCSKLSSTNKAVTLSSSIMAGGLTVLAEAKNDHDLVGGITADVAFEYKGSTSAKDVFTFANLYGRDKLINKPNEITATQQRVVSPDAAKDITMACTYEAVVRHVIKGDNTISEADDVVEMIRGKATANDMPVISKDHLATKLWTISDGRNMLELNGPTGQVALLFPTYEDAVNFMMWFKRSSADILVNSKISNGDYQIGVSNAGTLTDSFIKSCTVKVL